MRKPSLLTQILAVNALLLSAAVPGAVALSRMEIGGDGAHQALAAVAAILATILVNGFVVRRRLWPLERLIATMERVDLQNPGARVDIPEADSEDVVRLHHAFNRMLDRLEQERAATGTAVLRAQEQERARLARDLHDEANQSLTGLLLKLEAAALHAPADLRPELAETKALAGDAMDELLRLARELRPALLDDLGLTAALEAQVERFSRDAGIDARLKLNGSLDGLSENEQIVVYRVVQESLSNVAHHAAARHVDVAVGADRSIRVADDGTGFDPSSARGNGLVGMRERARLAGASVRVHSRVGSGTIVELKLGEVA